METLSISDARAKFGSILEKALEAPVRIVKKGTSKNVVILSEEEYKRLEALDDAYWSARAEKALETGKFLSPEESMQLIQSKLAEAE